jgi:hypothetical protein
MKTYRLTAAALAVSGLLAIGATQISATPGDQAHQPAVSTPSPDHQANVTSSSGGAPFDRHLYSPYLPASLTGFAGGGFYNIGGSYLIRGASQATLTSLSGGASTTFGGGYLIR